MLAFVTGATGFVGSHVARALAAQGAELRLLVRSSSDLRNIQELRAEQVVGDLRDAASLKKAVAGCDVVFHVAADYRLWVRDPDEMYRSNVEGTKAILEAARENKVRRVVYTSSVATMGFQSNGHLANEDSPVSLADMIGPYKRSKFMAEEIAIAGRQIRNGCGGGESDDSGGRARHQAHANRADRRRFSQEEISRLCGHGPESGGCGRVRPGSRGGTGEGKKRRTLHPGWRESYVEADSGQARRHYRTAVAEDKSSLCGCPGHRSSRSGGYWPHPESRTARHYRCRPHGPEKDVCVIQQSRARSGMENASRSMARCAGRSSGFGRMDMLDRSCRNLGMVQVVGYRKWAPRK